MFIQVDFFNGLFTLPIGVVVFAVAMLVMVLGGIAIHLDNKK
jgi:uncharacterized integral membrane protein